MQDVLTFLPILRKLAKFLPFAFAGVVIMLLAILAIVIKIVLTARKRQAQAAKGMQAVADKTPQPPVEEAAAATPADRAEPPPGALGLKRSFAEAMRTLKTHVSGRDYRYHVPWFLCIGEAGSGKSTLLGTTGLNLPLGAPDQAPASGAGCDWWFFDRGIVLDVSGEYVLRSDGKTSDQRGWQTLLGLLLKYRPQRPIDGVILTIPATDLTGPPEQQEARIARAKERAVVVSQKLWEAQRTLHMQFPVYVLVTKSDQTTGFSSFCSELPTRYRQGIFGWSSPYALGTAFSPDWVDEAFQNLVGSLYQAQTEVFTEIRGVRDPDHLFMFPAQFESMLAPLRVYMDDIFKQTVYHESFLLRGLYFCGDAEAQEITFPASTDTASPPEQATGPDVAAAGPPAPAADRRPSFLRDLLNLKVFPEHGLSRPTSKTFVSRHRATLITQVLLAVVMFGGSLGLWGASGRLNEETGSLLPVFRQISRDLPEVSRQDNVPQRLFNQLALELLRGMSRFRSSDLGLFFIPSSWFSGIHSDIVDALSLAYDKIIMKSMWGELNHRAARQVSREYLKSSLGGSTPTGEVQTAAPLTIEETPEFKALQKFVEGLEGLERHIKLFNGLQEAGFADLDALAQLIRYLFDIDLSSEFYSHTEYYQQALALVSGRRVSMDMYKFDAAARTRELMLRFSDRALDHNMLVLNLREIFDQLSNLSHRSRMGSAADVDQLRRLLDTITQTEAALAQPELAWVSSETYNLGAAFTQVLASVERSSFLGAELRVEFEEGGKAAFKRFQDQLRSYGTKFTGTFMEQEYEKLTMKLSPGLLELKANLANFLSQRFVALEPDKRFDAKVPQGTRLMWDAKALEDAAALADPYEPFVQNSLQLFPPAWQTTIRETTLQRLRANMLDLIAHAQVFEPVPEGFARLYMEDEIRVETRNFRESVKPLGKLLATFDRLGFAAVYNELFDLVVSQASRMLISVDELLEEEALYEVGNLSVWDGKRPLSLTIFGAQDADELGYYLDVQRERARFVASEYAEPLVTLLGNSKISRGQVYMPLLAKWQKILSEIRQYETKKVGSSLTALETFIRADMDAIALTTFYERIPEGALDARTGDYFLRQMSRLKRRIYDQCMSLAEAQVVVGYGEVEAFFNQRLAGRFPFAEVASDASAPEVDPEVLREFYRTFQAHAPLARAVLTRSPKLKASGSAALGFLGRMEAVRRFMMAYLEGDEKTRAPVPIFDFGVDFRVNKAYETGGNQIIGWEMTVGNQRIGQYDAQRQGRWRFGDPVRVDLRWAKDAPNVPVQEGTPGRLSPQGNTIVYDYTNRWALLSLLAAHASSSEDFDRFVDTTPHTLKFVVAARPRGDQIRAETDPPETAFTKVFVHVGLTTPDKKDRLVMPSFPRHAPALDAKAPGNAIQSRLIGERSDRTNLAEASNE